MLQEQSDDMTHLGNYTSQETVPHYQTDWPKTDEKRAEGPMCCVKER